MRRGILLTSTDDYSSYPLKVLVFNTPEEALTEFERLELELDTDENADWYIYPILIDIEQVQSKLKEL